MTTDPALQNIYDQWRRLRRKRSTVFPHEIKLPVGRMVYMTVMRSAPTRGYKIGEITPHMEVYLDKPPVGVPVLSRGQTYEWSGTTVLKRVQ